MLHHFKTACKAVEQVIECEISGPYFVKSCATHEEILPKVVGDASVCFTSFLSILDGCFQINQLHHVMIQYWFRTSFSLARLLYCSREAYINWIIKKYILIRLF
jgi:hypothetical protein